MTESQRLGFRSLPTTALFVLTSAPVQGTEHAVPEGRVVGRCQKTLQATEKDDCEEEQFQIAGRRLQWRPDLQAGAAAGGVQAAVRTLGTSRRAEASRGVVFG